jgi:GWxTD domain-containing protein
MILGFNLTFIAAPLNVAFLAVLLAASPTTSSRNERLAALPEEERAWLTEFIAPIILPEEEKLFLELTEAYQREIFKKAFWERREKDGLPRPFGPGFQRRYDELRPRLETDYDGWRSDAGRMVLRYGEPDDVLHVSCQNVFRDLEIWTLQPVSGVARQKVRYLFYRPQHLSQRKLWVSRTDSSGSDKQNTEIFVDDSCRRSFQDLACDCRDMCLKDPCLGQTCPEACDVFRAYQEVLVRQGGAAFGSLERDQLLALPTITAEGLDPVRARFPELADPRAKPLNVVGQTSVAALAPTPIPEPARLLSREEIFDRISKLDLKYRQFLDLAGPLLTSAELSDFLQLAPTERDRFIREFWKKRE